MTQNETGTQGGSRRVEGPAGGFVDAGRCLACGTTWNAALELRRLERERDELLAEVRMHAMDQCTDCMAILQYRKGEGDAPIGSRPSDSGVASMGSPDPGGVLRDAAGGVGGDGPLPREALSDVRPCADCGVAVSFFLRCPRCIRVKIAEMQREADEAAR